MNSKTGVLLVNLGTPDGPTTKDVRKYLAEFLMDPLVIDVPFIYRWLLVHGIILPTRPSKSARLYQKIWTDAGSPLLVHSLQLRNELRKILGETFVVELGMRYGDPSMLLALSRLKESQVGKIII